jgi:hypothetical protein
MPARRSASIRAARMLSFLGVNQSIYALFARRCTNLTSDAASQAPIMRHKKPAPKSA